MKARSVVFTHIQNPLTIFGLPPKMVVVGVAPAFLLYLLSIPLGLGGLSGIILLVGIVGGLIVVAKYGRDDPHIESVFLTSIVFWKAKARRALLAGLGDFESPERRP